MKKLKRNYLLVVLFLFVSGTVFPQNFSDICKHGTLNEIIQAINNNSDKDEKLKYDKRFLKYTNELKNTQYLLDSLNNDSTGINKMNNNKNSTSIYDSELKNNQDMINSLLNSQILSNPDNIYGINPLLNKKKQDLTTEVLGNGANTYQSNKISKNVIDSLKYNSRLSADDKKKILQILSMR